MALRTPLLLAGCLLVLSVDAMADAAHTYTFGHAAAALLPRLFDRFYRADPARNEGSSEHAGLGPAITQSIVRAHGGRIFCESGAGWTRFVIELPKID